MKLLDKYYLQLRSLFRDDDKIFGSRQLYLFSLTILFYVYLPLLLILRTVVSQDFLVFYKPIILIILLISFILLTFFSYKRYKNIDYSYLNPTTVESLFYILFFFFPYVLIILLFYE